ncbi:MAG: hypothetical protein EOO73_34130 [Myxococcales bacterium]|nr:MAG: hypothetical protein EOO73_34130 [Myxococcales bacterium]
MSPRFTPAVLLLGLLAVTSGCGSEAPNEPSGSGGAGGEASGSASGAGIGSGAVSSTGGSSTAPGSSGSASAGSNSQGGGGSGSLGGAGAASSAGNDAGGATALPDCKRGIAWPGEKLDHPEVSAKLTWWYRWNERAQSVGAGLELVPMIAKGGANVEDVSEAIRADAKYLLGFNEPNFFEQADLSAAEAAAEWPKVEAVAKAHGLQIVSPAVNYCGDNQTKTGPCHDTSPVDYLKDFFAACSGCQVDYVAVHWYNCDGASLNSYLDLFRQFERPLWLTEFACAYGGDTSVAGQEKYLREAIPILEGRADVFRYSWFSAAPIPNARLMNDDGSPNALGKVYLDLPHASTCAP